MLKGPGHVFEGVDGDNVLLGMVEKQGSSSVTALLDKSRKVKIPEKRIFVWHETVVSASDRLTAFAEINSAVEEVMADIDLPFLWEMMGDGHAPVSLPALAELYFGSGRPFEQAALLRAILQDDAYFARVGRTFQPRTAEQMQSRAEAEVRRAARKQLRTVALGWLKQTFQSSAIVAPKAALVPVVDALDEFLKTGEKSEVSRLLSSVNEQQSGAQVAFEILLRCGRLDPESDAWYRMVGATPEFPEAVMTAVEALSPYTADPSRKDYTHLQAFTIDDAHSRDLDDALTLEETPEGLRLGIHIADPSAFVHPGDVLDLEAQRRSVSVYIPSGNAPMFPERLSADLASLNEGELRPTLSFEALVDASGEVVDWVLHAGQIQVAHRLTYEGVNGILSGEVEHPLKPQLDQLEAISEARMSQRLSAGAFITSRPDVKVAIHGDQIEVKISSTESPAHRIVGEAMVLANTLAAQYGTLRKIPLIYRAQDRPANDDLQGLKMAYDPVRMVALARGLRRSRLTLEMDTHHGLGVSAYTQITSPIRRYVDLLHQRQLLAHLRGEQIPYAEPNDLYPILASAEAAERLARGAENRSKKYWVLKHLAQMGPEHVHEGLVLRSVGGGYDVELTALAQRGYLSSKASLSPGDLVQVRIDRIEPLLGRMRLLLVPPTDTDQ